jgi:Mn2+/Fe2+ NRAMP family transporter
MVLSIIYFIIIWRILKQILTSVGKIIVGTEKSHVKEVRKEIENGSDHGNDLAISLGIVIIERIDTTEIATGIGIGTGTEVRTGIEKEIAGVIEREDVIVIVVGNVIVIERGIMIGT